jgi:hypothetical protein
MMAESGTRPAHRDPESDNKNEDLEKRRANERWNKRTATCYRKLMELNELFGAEVYACLLKDGKYSTLKTTNATSFPPPDNSLVCFFYTKSKDISC